MLMAAATMHEMGRLIEPGMTIPQGSLPEDMNRLIGKQTPAQRIEELRDQSDRPPTPQQEIDERFPGRKGTRPGSRIPDRQGLGRNVVID